MLDGLLGGTTLSWCFRTSVQPLHPGALHPGTKGEALPPGSVLSGEGGPKEGQTCPAVSV